MWISLSNSWRTPYFIFKDGEIEKFYKDDLRGDKDKYLKNYAEVVEILKLNKIRVNK